MANKLTDKPIPALQIFKFSKDNPIFTCGIVFLLISLGLLIQSIRIQGQTFVFKRAVEAHSALPAYTDINLGNVALRIDGVQRVGSQPHFTAPEGKEYLILNFTVQNRTNQPIQVLPASDTYIKDMAGNVSYITPLALTNPFRAGELLPGDKIQGQLSFLVGKSKELKFYVDAVWSTKSVMFGIPN